MDNAHSFNVIGRICLFYTQIAEFYGATEGNSNIVNMDQIPGAVGFTSRIAPWAYPVSLIRVDEDSREVIRGPDGLCVTAQPGNDPLNALEHMQEWI